MPLRLTTERVRRFRKPVYERDAIGPVRRSAEFGPTLWLQAQHRCRSRNSPIGQKITMGGHFLGQVILEAVRWIGGGYECRVRLADGTPDEAILSEEEAAALIGEAGALPTPSYTNEREKRLRTSAPYSSKIIKAGALIGDTKTLLSHWNVETSLDENINRLQRDNVFGKASRSRVEDILAIFRKRYLSEKSVTKALVTLVRKKFPTAALDRLLYFHSARADQLLRDAVTEILVPIQSRGLVDIKVLDFQRFLAQWVDEGKTTGHWSESTITRIAQGLLSALRDFGVLQGAVNKKIAPAYLPVESFAYVAFYLKRHQPSGVKLIELPDWKLFFLRREGVERFLFEAHQRDLLEYHVAGSVTRLTFPVTTLEEYANVLAKR